MSKAISIEQIYRLVLVVAVSCMALHSSYAQEQNVPVVTYARPTSKIIAGIELIGNESYDKQVVTNISGLKVGQRVGVPGDEITQAVQNYVSNGLFSEISISASKIEGDSVWLTINIKEHPRLSKIQINGVKKSEVDNLKKGKLLALQEGVQATPNIINRSEIEIKRFFDDKGFSTATVETHRVPDPDKEGFVILVFDVQKNSKTTIQDINFYGNENITDNQLRMAMKKTNERFNLFKRFVPSILEIFSQKKFVKEDYKADLNNILDLYHSHGYRDAEIVKDTIYSANNKHINIDIQIYEGKRYYIKDINFVGNTKYTTENLRHLLDMEKGDIYDQKKLKNRTVTDEDAISNIYSNSGYLFININPIETEVRGDSVSLDIRIHEGKPANINKVIISGNDNVYEEVIRRELYTKPGMLFNRDYIIRTMELINSMGHFDQEKIAPEIIPNEDSGTVDIAWNLVPKSNDQVELSVGWSQSGLILMAGLKFSNFSMRNLFNPSTYKGFLPRGDGQTLALRAQTNARYYQSYSIQFMDPWFGRKRPNMLSVSAYYSRQTDINRRYFNNQISSLQQYNPYGYGYGYGYPYGYGYGGYDGYGYGAYNYGNSLLQEQYQALYESAYDPDKTLDMLGLSVVYGKRLTWPDDRFQFQAGINYTMYRMKNWSSIYYNFGMQNGIANDINLSLTLTRSSIDNPVYTRMGSDFSLSISSTLPYSLFDGINYSDPKLSDAIKNRFIEYYKVKGKGQIYIPLLDPTVNKRTPVLMFSAESGIIGSYNAHKRSPFGTYYMGGDGMSGYYTGYLNEMVALRGYKNGSIAGAGGQGAYAYSKFFMELRYPIVSENSTMIWAHLFAEAGNAWSQIQDMNPFQLKRSAGVGVRFMLPMVGLMGIDWGYGFDMPDGSSTRGGSNIHFILGQQF